MSYSEWKWTVGVGWTGVVYGLAAFFLKMRLRISSIAAFDARVSRSRRLLYFFQKILRELIETFRICRLRLSNSKNSRREIKKNTECTTNCFTQFIWTALCHVQVQNPLIKSDSKKVQNLSNPPYCADPFDKYPVITCDSIRGFRNSLNSKMITPGADFERGANLDVTARFWGT